MEKVTKKNPKRVEAAERKGTQARLMKMKEQILAGSTASNVPSNTINPTTNVPSNTSNAATTKSTDVYIYSLGLVAVLAVGLCVFFTPLNVKRRYSHSKLFSKLRINRRKKKSPTFMTNNVVQLGNK